MMGLITDDLRARLTAALGPEIPVLKPEQVRVPLEAAPTDAQGRPAVGKGERGLGVYLERWPKGYVQLFDADGLLGFDLRTLSLVPLDVYALTDAQATWLVNTIEAAVHSTPIRPTRFKVFTDARYDRSSPNVIRVSLQLQATKFIPLPGGN